ncbi:YetF domain-containing protein, partial [Niallia circulans]|uniref:YetF domain-containing protein n=1 Tax=Niallia circulans TaxID=1397 RepID=UPI00300A0815
DVEFSILETSGKLSVFEKEENKSSITIPLIMDGIIQESNLERIGKTNLWLRQQLKDKGYVNIKNISFCSYQDGEFYIDVIDH